MNSGCLINVLPVGGWENVLKFQNESYQTNTFGIGTKVFSILDGDIRKMVKKEYRNLHKFFLPIKGFFIYIEGMILIQQNIFKC